MARPPLDVAVIGAGLSGLAAAHLLARKHLTVEVFEASETLGGRVRSVEVEGRTLELGGQYVGARHRHVHALARALKVQLAPTGLEYVPTRWITSERSRTGRLPPLPKEEILPLAAALRALARYARRVTPEAPWESMDAQALDSRAFGAWVRSRALGPNATELLEGLVAGFAMGEGEALSLLQVLWWIARSGGLLAARADALGFFFPRGAERLAARLSEEAFPVRYHRPVHCLEQRKKAVVLTFIDGREDAAERAIVTAPFPSLAQMVFMPELPARMHDLATGVRFGGGTKTAFACARPPKARLALNAPARMLGGVVERKVAALGPGGSSDEALTASALASFGLDRADAGEVRIQRWSDAPFIGGTSALFRPGQLTTLGPSLRSHFGRVHFAGAERSSWPHAMEGALESGFHVASEVAASLGVELACPGCGWCATPENEITERAG